MRLREYDYSLSGGYYVTIVTQNRVTLFGQIQNGIFLTSPAGVMVRDWITKIEGKFSNAVVDEFVVMPNHIHAILMIVSKAGDREGAHNNSQPDFDQDKHDIGLSTMVQWFKTMTTNAYIHDVRENGWPAFPDRLWQRNYMITSFGMNRI